MQVSLIPQNWDIRIPRGDLRRIRVRLQGRGVPEDLGGLAVRVRGPQALVATATVQGGEIWLQLGPFSAPGRFPYELEVAFPDGEVHTVVWGTVEVVEGPYQEGA